MTLLRSLVYALFLYGLLIVMGIIWIPALLLPRGVTMTGVRWWAGAGCWGLKAICGVDTEIRGRENVPGGACLIASKHQAMYDTMVPFLIFDDPCFILKKELLWYPIFGWYARKTDMIGIDRDGGTKTIRSMTARAREEAAKGRQIVIFPEGTRKAPGAKPDYKPGAAMLYKELNLPCLPVALNTGLCWPANGIKRSPGKVVLDVLEPIAPGMARKPYMALLEDRIETGSEALRLEGLAAQGRLEREVAA